MAEGNESNQDDKTEEATPERREDFRERGQVVVSREMTSVLVLAATCVFVTFIMPRLTKDLYRLFVTSFEALASRRIDIANLNAFAMDQWYTTLWIILPFFAVTGTVAVGATLLQTRLNWSWKKLEPDWSRLNPLSGMKRMVSMQAAVEVVKGIAKMVAVGSVGYLILRGEWVKIPELMSYPIPVAWAYWGDITKLLFWSVAGLMLFVAGGDFLYNFISFERQIKMTKQEVKEEYKRRETDPQLKARQRRMHRDAMNRRSLSRTKEATVLITNPTHYSIALRYEVGMPAPIVVAKGIDFLALRMREVAKEHDIPIVENRPLARELYATVKEGEEIPDKLYKVAAEIIRYVYRLKGRSFGRSTPKPAPQP